MVNEVYYEVRIHITRVLHTARISNVDSVMFVNRIRETVSFEVGKEVEKGGFRLVISVGQRKTYESPRGIEPWTFGFRAPILSLVFIYKHDSIGIADPCSMQDACHMN